MIFPRSRWIAIACWLAGIATCCFIIGRTTFTADLSAFLPQSPTPEQRVLLDQLRDSVVSRLILTGIEGGDAETRAALSKETAQRLRNDPLFAAIRNGEPVNNEKDRAFLFGNRYLLSDDVRADRFTEEGLRESLGDSLDLLASPAGMLVKSLLPHDPTGETMHLLDRFGEEQAPNMSHGAWASRDGSRALLLAQTRASGADTDAQEEAIKHIHAAFDDAVKHQGTAASKTKLVMTGPGVFSVQSRQTIQREVSRLAFLGTALVAALLLAVYRSPTALVFGMLPVVSGALAGIAAVSLGYGAVHGITLGFGTTLIGEAVDYSIYLLVQSRQPASNEDAASTGWIRNFWPTIRLGVLTSIIGFASLLFSSFPGLSQLGLYSIAGLAIAAVVTRFVLPHMMPAHFRIRDVSVLGARLGAWAAKASVLRWPLGIAIVLAVAVIGLHHATLWNTQLSSLSPVSQADQAIDARLRADLGAPDVRYMVTVSAPDEESALQASEKISDQLQRLADQGLLARFESPSRYLPSLAAQRARQMSLPHADELDARLHRATSGLPIHADRLAPFIADVAAAKNRPPLKRADLDGTSFALAADSLLFKRGEGQQQHWTALLPLSAPEGGTIPSAPIRAALKAAGQPGALFIDMKAESDHLYAGYLDEAILLSLAGLGGIVVLLFLSLRSVSKTVRVVLPLIGAVACVAAGLVLFGERMIILHLIGLLLIVAVGSNYALFFNTGSGEAVAPHTLASLLFANMTTVIGFGLLAFSQVPVLHAIGITVGPGAVMALVFSAIFAQHPQDRRNAA